MRANICLPPERLVFVDGTPLRVDDINDNPYGRVGCYKITRPIIYTCPVSNQEVTLTDKQILDWLWAKGRPERISPFPPSTLQYLNQIGDGFDFMSPGGLQVRIFGTIEEMGKMSSDYFADLSLIIEVPLHNSR